MEQEVKMEWSSLFDKFFPKWGFKNIIYSNVLTIFRTVVSMFDAEVDEKLNRDI